MYKEVSNSKELQAFVEFWKNICDEKKYVFEESPLKISKKYIFFEEKLDGTAFDAARDKITGIVEITPYEPNVFSTLEGDFPFSIYDEVMCNQQKTFEIDKLAVSKQNRGLGQLGEILSVFRDHATASGGERYIALIESGFYRALTSYYKCDTVDLLKIKNPLPIPENKSKKPRGIKEGSSLLIPSLFIIRKENGEFQDWFLKATKSKEKMLN